MQTNQHFNILESQECVRADKFLSSQFFDLSRTHIQKSFFENKILCNDAPIKQSYVLQIGDKLSVNIEPPIVSSLQPISMPLDILFEDEHIIVINKPANIIIHASPATKGPTLVAGVLSHCELAPLGGDLRPGVVHRLDKGTSGAIIFAKTNDVYLKLLKTFKNRDINKIYHAIIAGTPKIKSGFIDKPIDRHQVIKTKMTVSPNGKEARSEWRIIEYINNKFSLVQVKILTGRTHQIRVHMAYTKYPIAGDTTYGYQKNYFNALEFPRVMLHAKFLDFVHPITNTEIKIDAQYPEDFTNCLNYLKTL